MGKGALNNPNLSLPEYPWEEIRRHNTWEDKWIVIEGYVYDVTNWAKNHPGGEKIISGWAGEDATDPWTGFHNDKAYVTKFMKTIMIGRVKDYEDLTGTKNESIMADFRKLRKMAEEMGLFKPSITFFLLYFLHLLAFDAAGWFVIYKYGTGWIPIIIGALLLATAQAQAGWVQHDYGHLSVFKNTRWNHWAQIFILNFFKGASSDWWNYRHLNHHSKPNILNKDPDVRFLPIFLLGKTLPKEWGDAKKKVLPYNHQHKYFFFLMPPLLLPLYFNYEIPYYLITRKRWSELFWMSTFFVRFYIMFGSMMGFWGMMALFLFVRFIESHWFVWVTQMNHIPMDIDYDHSDNWVKMQLKATCNVEHSYFNDWFTGHLNFQIEHHLFPTMPRHNYVKIAPLVKSMCKKHGLDYVNKKLLKACMDITESLRESGQMWYDAYNM